MRIAVTGACGFIGSHLCEALLEQGHEVLGIDLVAPVDRGLHKLVWHPGYTHVKSDLSKYPKAAEAFEDFGPEAVFHLAANCDIQAGMRNWHLDTAMGLEMSVNVFEAMQFSGCKNIFFSSSSTVYGDVPGSVLDENSPLAPISMYGASKMAVEAYLSVLRQTFGWTTTIMRFPNIVGGRATHGVIWDLTQKLRASPQFLEVLGDGSQSRPFLHVSDLIKAIMLVWESGETFVVSSNGTATVKEVAMGVCMACDLPHTKITYQDTDRGWPGDAPKLRYDDAKIRALGWEPSHTALVAACIAAVETAEACP